MSAQESGRQRKRRGRMADREHAGTAYQVHADQSPRVFSGKRLDEHAPGEHVWIVAATYRVSEREIRHNLADPKGAPILLDRESLAYASPAGCWVCEQLYTPALAARPCPGEP